MVAFLAILFVGVPWLVGLAVLLGTVLTPDNPRER
jgi:hypothetical protein